MYKKTKNQVTVAAEAYNLDEAVENAFDDEVREAFRLGHLNFGVIMKFINASLSRLSLAYSYSNLLHQKISDKRLNS